MEMFWNVSMQVLSPYNRKLQTYGIPTTSPNPPSSTQQSSYNLLIMHSLLLLAILPFSLAIQPTYTYTNITIPPFIPQLPDEPYNETTNLPFGTVLNHCSVPGTIALTFDDGPYIYTAQILDTLADHGARATFFLNGQNRGHINQFPDLVRRAHKEGHQLGSHT
jgi:hypothetical protein